MELNDNTVYQLCDHYEHSYDKEFNYFFILEPNRMTPVPKKVKNKVANAKLFGNNYFGDPNYAYFASNKFEIFGAIQSGKDIYTFKGKRYKIFFNTKGLGILDKIKEVFFIDVEDYVSKFPFQDKDHSLKDESQINQSESEISSLNQQIKELQTALTNKSKEYNETLDRMQSSINTLSSLNKQLDGKNNMLQTKLWNTTKELETLKQTVQDQKNEAAQKSPHDGQLHKLQTQLANKTKEMIQLNMKRQNLEKLLDDKQQSVDKLETQKNSLQTQLACKTKELEAYIAKAQDFEQQLKHKQQQIDDLNAINNQLSTQKKQLQEELSNQSREINEMKQKFELVDKKDSKTKVKEDSSPVSFHPKQKAIKMLDEIEIQKIEKVNIIGQGTCGVVHKVLTKQERALKEVNAQGNYYEDLKHLLTEYDTMNMLNHPNILKVYGIFLGNNELPPSILLDYCPTNLQNEISKQSLSNVKIVCIIYQIANGMKYVHLNKIIHRDLKPSDILINDEGEIKIGDFGLSRLMSAEDLEMTVRVGTANFMAPEIINGDDDYTEKVDVYSFGVLLYFVLSGGQMPNINSFDICNGKKAKIPVKFTEFSRKLIESCWSFDPVDRPSFKDICDQLEENKYSLIDLTKNEREKVLNFINEYKMTVPNYSI